MLQLNVRVWVIVVVLLACLCTAAQAQVGIGTTTVDASAVLELSSSARGFLPPRMTEAQRNAIPSPATGLLIYQTDATPGFYVFDGTVWAPVTVSVGGAGGWTRTGTRVQLNAAGDDVKIGGSGNANAKVDVTATGTNPALLITHSGTGAAIQTAGTSPVQLGVLSGTGVRVVTATATGVLGTTTISGSQWTTNGTDIHYNTGNVGIGVTAPTEKISISGTANAGSVGIRVENLGTGNLTAAGILGVHNSVQMALAAATNNSGEAIGNVGTRSNHPVVIDANGTEAVRIAPNGNVGIGTYSNPGLPLVIQREGGGGTGIAINNYGGAGNALLLMRSNGTAAAPAPTTSGQSLGAVTFQGQGASALPVSFVAAASIGSQAASNFSGTTGTASLTFNTNNGTGLQTRMTILATGDVGIGTNTPSVKLDVLGTVRSGGNGQSGQLLLYSEQGATDYTLSLNPNTAMTANVALTFPPNAGSADQILTTDGTGNLSWADAGAFGPIAVTTSQVGVGTTSPTGSLEVVTEEPSGPNAVDQQQTTFNASGGGLSNWQSFTAGVSGLLTQVELMVASGLSGSSQGGTIRIYAGTGTGGTLLSTTSVTFLEVFATFQTFALSTQPKVVAGNVYTIEFSIPTQNVGWVYLSTGNPYAGGRYSQDPNYDMPFRTYVTPVATDNTLYVSNGRVGIGTTTPAATLDVVGNVQFSGALLAGAQPGTSGQSLTSTGASTAPIWRTQERIQYTTVLPSNSGATLTTTSVKYANQNISTYNKQSDNTILEIDLEDYIVVQTDQTIQNLVFEMRLDDGTKGAYTTTIPVSTIGNRYYRVPRAVFFGVPAGNATVSFYVSATTGTGTTFIFLNSGGYARNLVIREFFAN